MFRNTYYQLGEGETSALFNKTSTSPRGDDSDEMGDNLTVVDLGTNFVPIDIEAGGYHICAMAQSKGVKCWGQSIHSLSIQYLYSLCITISL